MAYYDLTKTERAEKVLEIRQELLSHLMGDSRKVADLFDDHDTYIRKAAYLAIGWIFKHESRVQRSVLEVLFTLLTHPSFRVRQTVINAAGEIGKTYFEGVQDIFDRSLFDSHHSPRNAVIGSIKKMSEVNPEPVLTWARKYLHHHDQEIRREICHGIELRGRKYPQDILPLLKELETDPTRRVRKTLVHVLGQIAYKKGCLKTVLEHLLTWTNGELVAEAVAEIYDVHFRYQRFSAMSPGEAESFIHINFPQFYPFLTRLNKPARHVVERRRNR